MAETVLVVLSFVQFKSSPVTSQQVESLSAVQESAISLRHAVDGWLFEDQYRGYAMNGLRLVLAVLDCVQYLNLVTFSSSWR